MNDSDSTDTEVAIVVQGNYPLDRDVRTRKMAKSFDDVGANITIFARNSLSDPDLGQIKSSYLQRREDIGYAVVKRFSWLLSTPLFAFITAKIPVNPFWALWLVLRFRETEPDFVIACDIRAGLPAIIAAKVCGVPTVLDLRENFTELARSKPVENYTDYVVLNPALVATVERLTVDLADLVWVVTKERKNSLVESGKPESAVSVVGNTPYIREREGNQGTQADESTQFDWPGFTVVYVGSINKFRGLDLLVDGIWHANKATDSDPIHLAIAGDGPDKERLEQRVQTIGVDDHVDFLGWISPETVRSFLRSGDVGAIPHEVSSYTNETVPNKLFDYMLAGLPVVTTPTRPTARIVNETSCGCVLPFDASGTVTGDILRDMADSPEYATWAKNGRDSVETKYNWDTEVMKIRSALKQQFDINLAE